MTKAELIKALEPFGDDMEVFVQEPDERENWLVMAERVESMTVMPSCGAYTSDMDIGCSIGGRKGLVIVGKDDQLDSD